MPIYKFTTIIEQDDDGYFAYCPELEGCHAQGDSYEEALANIKDAVKLYVDDMLAQGEEPPCNKLLTFTTMEVTVDT